MSFLNNAHSWSASIMRGHRGLVVRAHNREHPPRPEHVLELYEFEGCPFCRKVRDVMSELDLAYVARPCPQGAKANRDFVRESGGKEQFPFLVDANTDTRLYESEEIINYLNQTYGPGRGAASRALSAVDTASAMAASVARPRGTRARPTVQERVQPAQLLELYNFENSPYCRKVRERLCELNLDYVVHNVAKKSARRPELVALGGKMMVPYLVDPNTDAAMYESDEILAYLERTYG